MLLGSSSSTCLQLCRVLPSALQLLRHSSTVAENAKQWQTKATKELKGKDPLQTLTYNTADVSSSSDTYAAASCPATATAADDTGGEYMQGIPVKPVYSAQDMQGLEHATQEVCTGG
jgi:hypothetical protein